MPGALSKLLPAAITKEAAQTKRWLDKLGPAQHSGAPPNTGISELRVDRSMWDRDVFPSQPVTPGKGVTVDGIRFVDGVHANLYEYGKRLEQGGRGQNPTRSGLWGEFEPVAAGMHDPEAPLQGPGDIDAMARDYYRSVTENQGPTKIGGAVVQPDDRAAWAAEHPDHEPRFKRGGALTCR